MSVLLLKRSVLTEKIARRGYHLSREYDVDPLEILFVSEVMERDILTFEADLTRPRTPSRPISDTDPAGVAARRQMLYPLLGDRRPLCSASSPAPSSRPPSTTATAAHLSATLGIDRPVVTHPDQTLRAAATMMAPTPSTGCLSSTATTRPASSAWSSLTMLLAGRVRDLQEARDADRVLRLRVLRPRRLPSAAGPTSLATNMAEGSRVSQSCQMDWR